MHSGQYIVEQEKCKVLLAEFYEGIKCLDTKYPLNDAELLARPGEHTKRVIKFTLINAETASYNPTTLELSTINFTAKPFIIPDNTNFTITFNAEIPEGTMGIEVIMHTGSYTRKRIMPLFYITNCDSYVYDYAGLPDIPAWIPPPNVPDLPDLPALPPFDPTYPAIDWAYVKAFCINPTGDLDISFQGRVSELTTDSLVLVGEQTAGENNLISPLAISVAGVDMTDLTTSSRVVQEEKYKLIDGEYALTTVDVTEWTATYAAVAENTLITFSGLYDQKVALKLCKYYSDPEDLEDILDPIDIPGIDDIYIDPDTDSVVIVYGLPLDDWHVEDNCWIGSGDASIKLGGACITPPDPDSTGVEYYKGDGEVYIRRPSQEVITLTKPLSFPFSMSVFIYFDDSREDAAYTSFLRLLVCGVYEINNNILTTSTDTYVFYDSLDHVIELPQVSSNGPCRTLDSLTGSGPHGVGKAYYTKTNIVTGEVTAHEITLLNTPIVPLGAVFDPVTFEVKLSCDNIFLPEPCETCNVADDILTLSDAGCPGNLSEYYSPCFQNCDALAMDQYPGLEGIESGSLSMDYYGKIYLNGLMVFDLPKMLDSIQIVDTYVNNTAFVMLAIMGIPFEYLNNMGGLSSRYFDYDDAKYERLFPNKFKINLSDLPGELQGNVFDWQIHKACDYTAVSILTTYYSSLPRSYTLADLPIDTSGLTRTSSRHSTTYNFGGGPIMFTGSLTLTNKELLDYAKLIGYLKSDNYHAYAIAEGIYEENSEI